MKDRVNKIIFEKIVILGASRGLGKDVLNQLPKYFLNLQILAGSRKAHLYSAMDNLTIVTMDFSKKENWSNYVSQIKDFAPTRIFYFSGGGPYGLYTSKKWSDHEWAINVNFLFPAFLLHEMLNSSLGCEQIVLTGSSVAESKPDFNASSYAAAKHGLRGLITTLQQEYPNTDLRLFSPGYMLTDLLPINSAPRVNNLASDPKEIAEKFLSWVIDSNEKSSHFALS